ncbi:MAG TPA: ATP-binding protein [Verrucomicrobiae bacterium]|jgi:signal transduction histidine kinase
MLRNVPIRRKLIAVNLLISGAVLLVTCLSFVTYEILTLRTSMVTGNNTRAELIAANSTASLAFQDSADAAEVLSALRTQPQIINACIYDASGHIFAQYPTNAPAGTFPTAPQGAGFEFKSSSLIGYRPVIQDGHVLGTVYIESDLSALTRRYHAYTLLTLAIIVCSTLLAYFLSNSLQKQISQPILALAETAKAVTRDRDFSVRAKKFGNDEVGALTDALNEMLSEIHKLNATLESRVHERTLQLEAANKELEAFSYSVSHDLRAPLRHVDGFVDMLRKSTKDTIGATGQRYLDIISGAAKRMGALIDDLLVFSRMGRTEMRRTQVNMDGLVAESISEMAQDLQGRAIEWDITPLPEVNGDLAMLRQVWVNLISNAVKYSRDRSPAKIAIHSRDLNEREVEFSVQDNGAGFDMQYAGKLFGVFQRLHLNEEFEGTGIGLANVRRIILRHAGNTRAEGKIGEGATFYFTMPKTNKTS